LENALKLDNPIFIDMRSPTEFRDGRIPGSINIPLFSDVERVQVGTMYKIDGPEDAKQLGLILVSAKLPEIVSGIRDLSKSGRMVVIYCWRGGMRSQAIVSVLEVLEVSAYQLVGGYKAYRRYVLESLNTFSSLPPIVVICGLTGVGKTTILGLLARQSIAVIDLEKLANHRGSAFGQIGLGRSETAQNFDAVLLGEMQRLSHEPFIVVECESKRIGNIYLPAVLYNAMQKGRKLLVQASIDTRISRLLAEYLDFCNERQDELCACLESLKYRFGPTKTAKLIDALSNKRFDEVVRSLLIDHYDKLYGYEAANPEEFDYIVDAEDLNQASSCIIEYLNRIRGE
jgi:tRNA 2-selenouridine synthase